MDAHPQFASGTATIRALLALLDRKIHIIAHRKNKTMQLQADQRYMYDVIHQNPTLLSFNLASNAAIYRQIHNRETVLSG